MANELWNFEALDLLAVTSTVGDVLGQFQWVFAAWLFCVGACFGSLLNVIVYRWPAGLSIVAPRSRCPRCGHGIRIYDNMPVLSWLVLRGRCRDCRSPISARYPSVEALVGLVFLALVLVEVFPREASIARGNENETTILWIDYLAHLVLVYWLIAAALIQHDGQRVPLRVYLPLLVVGVLRPFMGPLLVGIGEWQDGLIRAVGGVVVGGLFACLTTPAVGRDRQHRASHFLLLAMCGLMLGWPAVVMVSVCFSLLSLMVASERRLRPNVMQFAPAGFLTLSVLVVLVYWSALGKLATWMNGEPATSLLVSVPVVAVVSLVARRLNVVRETRVLFVAGPLL